MEPDDALPLDAAALRQAALRSPLALHAQLEQACTKARRLGRRRLWLAAAECNQLLRQGLEDWGFVRIPAIPADAAPRPTLSRPELYLRAVGANDTTPRRKIDKIEPPLNDDQDVFALVDQFETGALPFEHWTHRAHLAVGVAYLRAFTFEESLQRLRRHLQLYNQLRGDPAGYHETITRLYLRKIAAVDRPDQLTATPIAVRVEQLARECSPAWVQRYYSRDRLNTRESRNEWIEPDLRPLDF